MSAVRYLEAHTSVLERATSPELFEMPTALNGHRVSASCAAASGVLSAYPRGAYTSGLLLPSGFLAHRQQHLHRLAKSLHLLAKAGLLNAPEALQQQLATAFEVSWYFDAASLNSHTLASFIVCWMFL